MKIRVSSEIDVFERAKGSYQLDPSLTGQIEISHQQWDQFSARIEWILGSDVRPFERRPRRGEKFWRQQRRNVPGGEHTLVHALNHVSPG